MTLTALSPPNSPVLSPQATGGSGSVSNIFSQELNLSTGQNFTQTLDAYAAFGYTIGSLKGVITQSGTITVAIQINGVSVAGLSAVAASSVTQNVTATANNIVLPGDIVTAVFSSNSSAIGFASTLISTRTS